jgi:hypothetical protein
MASKIISTNICEDDIHIDVPVDMYVIRHWDNLYNVFAFRYYKTNTHVSPFSFYQVASEALKMFLNNFGDRNYLILNCRNGNDGIQHLINIALDGKLMKCDELHEQIINNWISWRLNYIGEVIAQSMEKSL